MWSNLCCFLPLPRAPKVDTSHRRCRACCKLPRACTCVHFASRLFPFFCFAQPRDIRPVSDGRVADVVHEVTRAISPASLASSDAVAGESVSFLYGGTALTPSVILARPTLAVGFPVPAPSAAVTPSRRETPRCARIRCGCRLLFVCQKRVSPDGQSCTASVAPRSRLMPPGSGGAAAEEDREGCCYRPNRWLRCGLCVPCKVKVRGVMACYDATPPPRVASCLLSLSQAAAGKKARGGRRWRR